MHSPSNSVSLASASGLPPLAPGEAVEYQHLDPRIVQVWRLGNGIVAIILSIGAAMAAAALELPVGPIAAGAVVLLAGFVWTVLVPPVRYGRWHFAVRARDLVLARGVLWRTVSIVPIARIQHVDTTQGPLQRALGLASVVVFTAGTSGAMVDIPGLDAERAESLRDSLAALSGSDDAV